MSPRFPTLMLATATLAACGTDTAPPPADAIETIGDTTVVHSRSEGAWGAGAALVPEVSIGELDGPEEYLFGNVASIAVDDDGTVHVLDAQAQEVRIFDSAGTHVGTLGGRGEGPGELSRGEAIAVLPDGRLLVRDPANMRVQVFGPGPGETDEWRYNSGNHFTDRPLYTDSRGHTYLFASDVSRDDASILVELAADGTPLDTFPEPTSDHRPAVLRAEFTTESSSSSTSMNVPFSPFFTWTLHPSGHFLSGLSTEYRIDLAGDDGTLRIKREHEPVPVSDTERDFSREMIEDQMRQVDPDWSWDGPPIPDYKPPFMALHAGRDGRIWVLLATAASIVENEDHDPDDPSSQPVIFHVRGRYDVFESDGTYLGAVEAPDEFSGYPQPVFDGDHVWAVARDELGVERVVRYRIVVDGRDIAAAQEALTETVMALAGVVGTAVGECDGEPCVKVYLSNSTEELTEEISGDFGGFPVVTEVTGEVRKRDHC